MIGLLKLGTALDILFLKISFENLQATLNKEAIDPDKAPRIR